MSNPMVPIYRSGQSDIAKEEARIHTVLIIVEDRPGSIDRVIGALRRRRANMQNFTLGRGERVDRMRITAQVNDSEVEVDHLLEQLRKIVDVRQAVILQPEQTIVREIALVKVSSTAANVQELRELGQTYNAAVVEQTGDSITFEISGSVEKIEQFVEQVQSYGIREIARSGSVTITRALEIA